MTRLREKQPFEHSIAVIVGIKEYENGITPLQTPVNDAEELASLLENNHKYEVICKFDRQATKQKLEQLLFRDLPERLKLIERKKTRLLFYFAGHGKVVSEDKHGPVYYLLPQDAKKATLQDIETTSLSAQKLYDALKQLNCHHLLLILDCCFAGAARLITRGVRSVQRQEFYWEHYEHYIKNPAWHAIASAAQNQEALDFVSDLRGIGKNSQHSPFAEVLIKGLRDNKEVRKESIFTRLDLYAYLEREVSKLSGEKQIPASWSLELEYDIGQYIFLLPGFDPDSLKPAPKLDKENNPYRGLESFEEEHARFFFGRDDLIESLYERISQTEQQLTVVLGVSGSGKSSLVKAGLIPYLRQEHPQEWYILTPIRPGESPFISLARTILPIVDVPIVSLLEKIDSLVKQFQGKNQNPEVFNKIFKTWSQSNQADKQRLFIQNCVSYSFYATTEEQETEFQKQLRQVISDCVNHLSEQLQTEEDYLITTIKIWSQKRIGSKLLLVIDQFEELITLSQEFQPHQANSKTQQQFLTLLEKTLKANLPQLRLVVTLRSDFEPRFLDSEVLKLYWTKARFVVSTLR